MQTLDIQHQIAEEYLNRQYYFESLTEQAVEGELLTEAHLSRLQTDLMAILSEQADKWSKGESTSIPVEKAQELMASIMFVLGVQLKSYSSPDLAAEALKAEPLKKLFDEGLKLIRQKIAVARHMQKHIMTCLMDTPNIYYKSTIVDGINGFFKLYKPEISAQEIHITADYPVLPCRPQLFGIEFIEQYLRCIKAENDFCILFRALDIHHLLCGLTQDYQRIPINIFEPVLLSALGLVMLCRNPINLNLSREDVEALFGQLYEKTDKEIERWLEQAYLLLEKELEPKDSFKQYLNICFPKLTATIKNAVATRTLDKVFLVPAYPEEEIKIELSYGERMDDRKYKKLLEKVLQMDSSIEKTELILQEIHSLADLLDFLSDAELCREEFEIFVNRLPLPALVLLFAEYPIDDFLERESEQFLFAALQKRKAMLSEEELQQVEQVLKSIKQNPSKI